MKLSQVSFRKYFFGFLTISILAAVASQALALEDGSSSPREKASCEATMSNTSSAVPSKNGLRLNVFERSLDDLRKKEQLFKSTFWFAILRRNLEQIGLWKNSEAAQLFLNQFVPVSSLKNERMVFVKGLMRDIGTLAHGYERADSVQRLSMLKLYGLSVDDVNNWKHYAREAVEGGPVFMKKFIDFVMQGLFNGNDLRVIRAQTSGIWRGRAYRRLMKAMRIPNDSGNPIIPVLTTQFEYIPPVALEIPSQSPVFNDENDYFLATLAALDPAQLALLWQNQVEIRAHIESHPANQPEEGKELLKDVINREIQKSLAYREGVQSAARQIQEARAKAEKDAAEARERDAKRTEYEADLEEAKRKLSESRFELQLVNSVIEQIERTVPAAPQTDHGFSWELLTSLRKLQLEGLDRQGFEALTASASPPSIEDETQEANDAQTLSAHAEEENVDPIRSEWSEEEFSQLRDSILTARDMTEIFFQLDKATDQFPKKTLDGEKFITVLDVFLTSLSGSNVKDFEPFWKKVGKKEAGNTLEKIEMHLGNLLKSFPLEQLSSSNVRFFKVVSLCRKVYVGLGKFLYDESAEDDEDEDEVLLLNGKAQALTRFSIFIHRNVLSRMEFISANQEKYFIDSVELKILSDYLHGMRIAGARLGRDVEETLLKETGFVWNGLRQRIDWTRLKLSDIENDFLNRESPVSSGFFRTQNSKDKFGQFIILASVMSIADAHLVLSVRDDVSRLARSIVFVANHGNGKGEREDSDGHFFIKSHGFDIFLDQSSIERGLGALTTSTERENFLRNVERLLNYSYMGSQNETTAVVKDSGEEFLKLLAFHRESSSGAFRDDQLFDYFSENFDPTVDNFNAFYAEILAKLDLEATEVPFSKNEIKTRLAVLMKRSIDAIGEQHALRAAGILFVRIPVLTSTSEAQAMLILEVITELGRSGKLNTLEPFFEFIVKFRGTNFFNNFKIDYSPFLQSYFFWKYVEKLNNPEVLTFELQSQAFRETHREFEAFLNRTFSSHVRVKFRFPEIDYLRELLSGESAGMQIYEKREALSRLIETRIARIQRIESSRQP